MVRLPRFVSSLYLLVAGLLLASCTLQAPLPTASEALADDPELSALADALTAEGLVHDVEAADSVTIFAPTDQAFQALAAAQVGLPEILLYHVAEGAQTAAQLADGEVLGTFYANSALGIAIPGDVELVDGGTGATVVETDIQIANGVIHKIDAVLTPPEPTATVATNAGFSSLVDALVAAGLDTSFDDANDGPYTVFAPTNTAFADVLAAYSCATLSDFVNLIGVPALTDILTYHVSSGIVGEAAVVAALTAGDPVPTLYADDLTLTTIGGNAGIVNPFGLGDATVTATNVVTANGVIHVIDEVLVPFDPGAISCT